MGQQRICPSGETAGGEFSRNAIWATSSRAPDGHCTLRRPAVWQFLAEGKEVDLYESQSLSANTEKFRNPFHDNENHQYE